jgi:hypothetical protein
MMGSVNSLIFISASSALSAVIGNLRGVRASPPLRGDGLDRGFEKVR